VVGVLADPAVAAGGPTIKVSLGTVQAGQIVRIYGVAPGCPSGNEVTLISAAFSHAHDFAGLPAVFAHVGAHSAYSVRIRIPAARRPGRYQITGRCGGGNLGVAASLRVLAAQALGTSADIDGDGRPDAVRLLSHGVGTPSTLQVTLATGRVLTAPAGDGFPPARLLRIANVDGRRGAEIFVDTAHISTEDTISIYTYRGGRLTVGGRLFAFGGDFGIKFGFNCTRQGALHAIVSHLFLLTGGRWTRADTTYVWRSGQLKRTGPKRTAALRGSPPRSQTGVGC
jgi:hypothetical protein